jgi:hypothetical protein
MSTPLVAMPTMTSARDVPVHVNVTELRHIDMMMNVTGLERMLFFV